jgi:hypothetical protein
MALMSFWKNLQSMALSLLSPIRDLDENKMKAKY